MVTRRCTQRQFLLRPDKETNNAFVYCLAIAAQRYDITVLDFIQMSNHLHDQIYDPHGNTPAFCEHFHKLLAKCMNALRGRWENFFSSEQVCVVRIERTHDLIEKLVYIATNPVKAGLVERVADWPGASGYTALMTGRPLRATRPKHFFTEDGTMPESIELHLTIPPELGDREQILEKVRARVEEVEREEAAKRAANGTRVMGAYAVRRQSWRETPTSREPRRGLRPTVAARNFWVRMEALLRKRDFVIAYREARCALLAGSPIPFPAGTYGLRRYIGVAVMPFEKFN